MKLLAVFLVSLLLVAVVESGKRKKSRDRDEERRVGTSEEGEQNTLDVFKLAFLV